MEPASDPGVATWEKAMENRMLTPVPHAQPSFSFKQMPPYFFLAAANRSWTKNEKRAKGLCLEFCERLLSQHQLHKEKCTSLTEIEIWKAHRLAMKINESMYSFNPRLYNKRLPHLSYFEDKLISKLGMTLGSWEL